MKRRLLSVLLFIGGCGTTAIASDKPNVLFILMDDLGWSDLSCFGSEYYQTPNIDKLAMEIGS